MLEDLMAKGSIRIYDYGIDRRRTMSSTGRCFPFYVMSYLSEGHAVLRLPDREIVQSPHSVIMIPANLKHDHVMLTEEESVFWWWHFDYKAYDSVDLLRLLHLPVVHTVGDAEEFETRFRQYSDSMRLSDSLGTTLFRLASMLEVLGYLLDDMTSTGMGQKALESVPDVFLEILDEVTADDGEPFSLQVLAQRHSMHPTYVSNRFAHYFGIPPVKLRRSLTMKSAAEMLTDGKSVAEIAELLGFSDASSFSRSFRSVMGSPPSAVKKSGGSSVPSALINL